MATATKSKKKASARKEGNKPLTFKQLMGRVSKHETYPSILKTAATDGWLTTIGEVAPDQEFLTQLSKKEAEQVQEAYKVNAKAKKAAPAVTPLPVQCGPLVDDTKVSSNHVRLSSNGRTVSVDTQLFLTLKKRHPDANVYLSDAEDGPVIFSEMNTVALLSIEK